ncbi:MAG: ATP-binding protein, partial [Planctomycetota bacterium]
RRHLDDVFKPFFTTKPAGQGTGLGLAAVQRFVLSSSGDVVVESEPGQGACFSLCFPLATADAGEN